MSTSQEACKTPPHPDSQKQTWIDVACAKDLGRAIAHKRKTLGYGLVDAAALCQVGTRFLHELEHGKSTVEFNRALRVARRFGLRVKISAPDE